MSSPLARFQDADWAPVPDYLHRPLERWLTDGIEPYSKFLRAVLRNDLVGSVRQARPIERSALAGIVDFLSNECPGSAYGSVPIYREWQRIGGWRGMRDAADRIGESYD
jgi:hypothetical protein